MGFFDSLKNIAQGKPVFDEQSAQSAGKAANQPVSSEYHDEKGKKIYPEIIVERALCELTHEGMRVFVNLKNDSEFPLVLDRLRFLGRDKQMPSDLSIGEVDQYLLYDGPRPRSNRDVNFEITYYNATRDFFSAMYYADYKPEADGTFSVKQFRKQRNVKDI